MKIKINGNYIEFFDEVAIQLNLDSVASVFSFVGRYNPDNELHKKVFRPLSYAGVEIYNDNDQLRLTGTIVNHSFNSDSRPNLWQLSGYSLPGVLEDVNIPYDLYPLESINRNLNDITQRLINPFGLGLVVDPSVTRDVNTNFDESVANPSESIKSYLAKIAAQRNIILSHDFKGNLKYFRPNTKAAPKMRFNENNTLQMSLGCKGQGLHSDLTVIRQPSDSDGNLSPVDSVKNSAVRNFRPAVQVLTSGTDTATKQAAENMLAAELKNIEIKLVVNKILDLVPGDLVEVQNPELFIFDYAKMMISSVGISENTKESRTELVLVLPESFTGETPKNIFE